MDASHIGKRPFLLVKFKRKADLQILEANFLDCWCSPLMHRIGERGTDTFIRWRSTRWAIAIYWAWNEKRRFSNEDKILILLLCRRAHHAVVVLTQYLTNFRLRVELVIVWCDCKIARYWLISAWLGQNHNKIMQLFKKINVSTK